MGTNKVNKNHNLLLERAKRVKELVDKIYPDPNPKDLYPTALLIGGPLDKRRMALETKSTLLKFPYQFNPILGDPIEKYLVYRKTSTDSDHYIFDGIEVKKE